MSPSPVPRAPLAAVAAVALLAGCAGHTPPAPPTAPACPAALAWLGASCLTPEAVELHLTDCSYVPAGADTPTGPPLPPGFTPSLRAGLRFVEVQALGCRDAAVGNASAGHASLVLVQTLVEDPGYGGDAFARGFAHELATDNPRVASLLAAWHAPAPLESIQVACTPVSTGAVCNANATGAGSDVRIDSASPDLVAVAPAVTELHYLAPHLWIAAEGTGLGLDQNVAGTLVASDGPAHDAYPAPTPTTQSLGHYGAIAMRLRQG